MTSGMCPRGKGQEDIAKGEGGVFLQTGRPYGTFIFLFLAVCVFAGCSFKPARVEFQFEVPEADSNPFRS